MIHGAENSLALFLPPGSIVIEVHPGFLTPSIPFDDFFMPIYQASQLKFLFFQASYANNGICSDWYSGLLLSPVCGTHIDKKVLADVFDASIEYMLAYL